MNKGFKHYFKNSFKLSKKAFKKKGNLIRYYAYLISSLFARIILALINPIFNVTDYRVAKMVRKGGDIIVSKSYEPLDSPKKIWNSILTVLLISFLFVAGIIVILIPTGILGFVGYMLCVMIGTTGSIQTLIIGLFAAPGAILLLLFMIIFTIRVIPSFYILEAIPDAYASESIKNSLKIMKENKKAGWTMFLNFFIPGLYKVLYLGVAGLGFYLFLSYEMSIGNVPMQAVAYIVGAVLAVVFLIFAPYFTIASRIANTELFDDLFIEQVKDRSKAAQGVFVKKAKKKKIIPVVYSEHLVDLFNETEEIKPVELKQVTKHDSPVKDAPIDIDEDKNWEEKIKIDDLKEVEQKAVEDEKQPESEVQPIEVEDKKLKKTQNRLAKEQEKILKKNQKETEKQAALEEKQKAKDEAKAQKEAEQARKAQEKAEKEAEKAEKANESQEVEEASETSLEQETPVQEEPAAEEPVKDEPVEELVQDEPVVEEPVQEEPATEEIAEEQVEEPVQEEPQADDPAQESKHEEPVAEEPTEEQIFEEPSIEAPEDELISDKDLAESDDDNKEE